MAVQINVQASQTALAQSISQGVAAYNARFASQNQLNLQVNPRSFSQPLGRITSDLADFESALKASNARVLAFGASTAVLGGSVKVFKEIANITIEIEKSLTDVNRVLGLSTSGLQKFSTELFSISKQTASSFDDATKAALEFSRQGLNTQETLKRTADALTLVRLTGISSRQAVEDLTSTINGFSKAGLTTSQVVNKLAAVEQDFAVSASDLTEALSRTGQAAQEAGVGFDELNALVTTAQQSTARGGAVIGNALKTIFTRLQRTDTLDQLENFNISVRDIEGNILPATQILKNFADQYKNLADSQRAQLSEQVAGVYQVNILKGIIGDLSNSQGTYTKALERGAMASNEADIANQKLNKTLSALSTQTGLGLQQLANNVGKVTFAPIFEAIVSPINDAVTYINETLEGEGPGSIFANGLLKGIRNVITGPGLAVAFAVIAKVAKNTFEDATKALPAILGITTEAQRRANIEKSILAILQTQSTLSLALQGQQGNATAQAATVLNYAKLQTAQYQQQLQIAQQLAPLLAAQNVTIGARGVQVGAKIKAGGHIPAFAEMSERMGAAMGGYKSGKVVKAPRSVGANTYMNTAEEAKYVPGFAQPFINPPAGSKAGRAHRQNAINRTGVDPYMANGFIANFAKGVDPGERGKEFEKLINFNLINKKSSAGSDLLDFALPSNALTKASFKDKNKISLNPLSLYGDAKIKSTQETKKDLIKKLVGSLDSTTYGKLITRANKIKSDVINLNDFLPLKPSLISSKSSITKDNENASVESVLGFHVIEKLQRLLKNKNTQRLDPDAWENKKLKLTFIDDFVTIPDFSNSGFIPNFAIPVDSARIPWFKKYASSYKNTASDKDIFRQIDFPTYGKGLDHSYAKIGNPDMVSFLYEDFVRSAMNIALGSKQVVRSKEAGFKNTPTNAISNRDPIDLAQKISGAKFRMLEVKQSKNNQKETISQISDAKLRGLFEENPELAKNVELMSIIFNDPRYVDPTGKNPAGILSPFEQSIAPIVKNSYADVDSTMRGKLGLLTDGLMKRYQSKKNSFSKGFIPNFAGKDIITKFFKTQTGPDLFSSKGTGLSGTVYKQPGYRSSGYQLKEQLNNMVMSILGNNVFFPDASSLNPKIYGDVNKGAENSAKTAALKLSSGGKTSSLGLGAGMMSEAFGNSRYVPDREAVFTGQVSGKMKRVNYDRLSDILGAFWSANPETKSAWESLKNTSETGKFEEKQNIRVKTSLLKKAYEDFLVKNNYIGTRVKLNSYRKRAEGVEGVNYGALRSDLAGVSNVRNIDKYGGFIPNFANNIDATSSAMRKALGLMPFLVDLKRKTYAEGDMFHYQIANSKFIDPETGKSVYGSLSDKDMHGSTYQDTFVRGFYNASLGKADFELTKAQKEDKNFMPKHSALLEKVKARYAERFKSAIPVKTKRVSPLAAFRNEGFIPNFAYKQAVMGLEESMSGNKAVLDTKSGPFPFVRNTSQSNFASAISDHGGLSNALSDSMRNQEAAGLMNKGYVPNFATINAQTAIGASFGSLKAQEQKEFVELNKALSQLARNTKLTTQQQQQYINTVMNNAASLAASTKSTTIVSEASKALATSLQQNQNAQKKAAAQTQAQKQTQAAAPAAAPVKQSRLSKIGERVEKLTNNVAFAIGTPMLGGILESVIGQGKDRSEMGYGQRLASSGASAALTGLSTGAGIGTAILPGIGTAAGAAIGAIVGFSGAMIAAKTTLEDLSRSMSKIVSNNKSDIDSAKKLLALQTQLGSESDPYKIIEIKDEIEATANGIKNSAFADKILRSASNVDEFNKAVSDFSKSVKPIEVLERLPDLIAQMSKELNISEQGGMMGVVTGSFKQFGSLLGKSYKNVNEGKQYPFLSAYAQTEKEINKNSKKAARLADQTFTGLSGVFLDLENAIIKDKPELLKDYNDLIKNFSIYKNQGDLDLKLKPFIDSELISQQLADSIVKVAEGATNIIFQAYLKNLSSGLQKQKGKRIQTKGTSDKLAQDVESTKDVFSKINIDISRSLSETSIALENIDFKSSLDKVNFERLGEIFDISFSSIGKNLEESAKSQFELLSSRFKYARETSALVERETSFGETTQAKQKEFSLQRSQRVSAFLDTNLQPSEDNRTKAVDFIKESELIYDNNIENIKNLGLKTDGASKRALALFIQQEKETKIKFDNAQKNSATLFNTEQTYAEKTLKLKQKLAEADFKLDQRKLDNALKQKQVVESFNFANQMIQAKTEADVNMMGIAAEVNPNFYVGKSKFQQEDIRFQQERKKADMELAAGIRTASNGNQLAQFQQNLLADNSAATSKNSDVTKELTAAILNISPNPSGVSTITPGTLGVKSDKQYAAEYTNNPLENSIKNLQAERFVNETAGPLLQQQSIGTQPTPQSLAQPAVSPEAGNKENKSASFFDPLFSTKALTKYSLFNVLKTLFSDSPELEKQDHADMSSRRAQIQARQKMEKDGNYVMREDLRRGPLYSLETRSTEQLIKANQQVNNAIDDSNYVETDQNRIMGINFSDLSDANNNNQIRNYVTKQQTSENQSPFNDLMNERVKQTTSPVDRIDPDTSKLKTSAQELIKFKETELQLLKKKEEIETRLRDLNNINLNKGGLTTDEIKEQVDLTTQKELIDQSVRAAAESRFKFESKTTEEMQRQVAYAKYLASRGKFTTGTQKAMDTIKEETEMFKETLGTTTVNAFRDGLVGAMDAALNKADDLESALMGVASGFLKEIQGVMLRNIANQAISSFMPSFGAPATGNQRGGFIHAQKGMYISGGRTGDKNPALLEDGEYVLNRNAVQAMGGPSAIDKLNFETYPRFGGKQKGGKITGFAVGGDPGSMSASVNLGRPFENLSGFGRDQSPEFQVYMEDIREAQAKKDKKKAERKALVNSLIATAVTTGVMMGISSGAKGFKSKTPLNKVAGSKPNFFQRMDLKKAGVAIGADGLPVMQTGGAVGFNQGGFLPYGSRLTDTIPAYLSGGEYVVNSKAVRKYGVGGLNRINSGVARFAEGGMVGDNQSESNNTSNSTANNISINITVNANGNGMNKEEKDNKGEGTEGPVNDFSNRIKAVVLEVISTEQRTGGLLDSTKKK